MQRQGECKRYTRQDRIFLVRRRGEDDALPNYSLSRFGLKTAR